MVLVALLQHPDAATAMVRAEALARRSLVAVPLALDLPAVSAERSWTSYAAHVEGSLDATPEGFARKDRPLLISPRASSYSGLDSWPLLSPIRRMVESMSDEDFSASGGGRFSKLVIDLSQEDQRFLRSRIGPPNVLINGQPIQPGPDDRLTFGIGPQIAFYGEDSKGAGVFVGAKPSPFDPTRYLDKLRFKEPDPVPDALAKAVGSRAIALPSSALALPAWADLLKGAVDLRVDSRAREWRVALGAPGATVSAVDALRAVARAQRLYWRPVGDAWVLAASPSDPRPFASELVRAKAMADLAIVLDRMARAGFLVEDVLALLVDANGRKVGDLPAEDVDRIRRLLASGSAWEGRGKELDAMLASPKIASATLGVYFSMNVRVEGPSGSNGVGVMLP